MLDWLNEITDPRINFFGLEVELWRIGDSPPAPKFNVVCKPNDWSRTVADVAARVEAAALTENKQLQLRFWGAFCDYLAGHSPRIQPTKPQPQNWMNLRIGRTGFRLAAVASFWDSEAGSYDSHELRAELVIDHRRSKEFFALLVQQREIIESELGYALTWHNPPAARSCRLYVRRAADVAREADWPEQHRWLAERSTSSIGSSRGEYVC